MENAIKFENISKEDFEAYEGVRQSGVTNMFMVNVVCDLSALSRSQVMLIMKNYDELCQKYPGVRED